MTRLLGLLLLAATVILLGHPAVALPPLALLPVLLMLLPLLSFYATVVPDEPQLCRVQSQNQNQNQNENQNQPPQRR